MLESNTISSELGLIIAGFYAGYYDLNNKPKNVNYESNKNTQSDVLKIKYSFHNMEKLRLQKLLNSNKIQEKLTTNHDQRIKVKVQYTYDAPVSRFLCNYKRFLNDNSIDELLEIADSTCDCNAVFKKFVHPTVGHVITADTQVIDSICHDTARLMGRGIKFRSGYDHITNKEVDCIKTEILKLVEIE
jgi:hypothetical protein